MTNVEQLRFSDRSDEDILSFIGPQVMNRVRTNLSIPDSYSLAITGTVGSGKSTICESLSVMLRTCNNIYTNNFPEFLYVNDDVSHLLLLKKIKGEISNVTFQNFVLDNWEYILQQRYDSRRFNIFERCADDSVLCFCNIDNAKHKINDLELHSMFCRLRNIDMSFDIPTYFDDNLHFKQIISGRIDAVMNEVLDVIESDAANGIKKRVIGLVVSDYVSKYRINERNRPGEREYYTESIINMYNTHYTKLFQVLNEKRCVSRFLDLGMLM